MASKKSPVVLETAFNRYSLGEILGEGGAGRVYAAEDDGGARVALKLLTAASADKRRRFKNEIAFLARNRHAHVVTVLDHGFANAGTVAGPFYVMPRFERSLRAVLKERLSSADALKIFGQMLDGVEAAHLQGATHRDLKPENFLLDGHHLVVADFGIAEFIAELLHTHVETAPSTRLANFQYAAPEQRVPGAQVGKQADFYALGLMLNELFTGRVPHGTGYATISAAAPELAFLDEVVAAMIRQDPAQRPQQISEVKALIQRYRDDAVSLQKLSQIDKTVIKIDEIDEPLAHEAPIVVDGHYRDGQLTFILDRAVNPMWVHALHSIGNFTCVSGYPPEAFGFEGNRASVRIPDHAAQMAIVYFKQWLPQATLALHSKLKRDAQDRERVRKDGLKRAREAEQQNLEINRRLKF